MASATPIAGAETTVQLQVDTLRGSDTVKVGGTALEAIGVGVDLGTGQR